MILKYLLKKLHEEFNTENIYSEDVPQGVKLPAFFVRIVNTAMDPLLGNRYLLRTMFSITYVHKAEDDNPDDDKPKPDDYLEDLEDMRFEMMMAVKQIDRDNFGLEARNVETRINDNSIVLTCNYDLLIEEEEVGDTMQDLEIVTKPKEDKNEPITDDLIGPIPTEKEINELPDTVPESEIDYMREFERRIKNG